MKKLVGALATGVLATFLVVAPQAAATATGCEPAYIGVCLPVSNGSNDVDCTDAVVTKSSFPLVSKHNDPFKLDDVGVGDGIACEHNDKPGYTNPGYTKPPTTPPATTPPTKTPTSAPATSPTREPSPDRPSPTAPTLAQTPVAGGNLPWIGGGAAVLLVVGAVLFLAARRRRTRFVAGDAGLG
jgi:hypothetical protein